MTPKEGLDLFEQIDRDNDLKRSEDLARAKADAAVRGKEPFDLKRLEALSPTEALGERTPEARQKRFEVMYYIEFPELMTIEELAIEVNELSRW